MLRFDTAEINDFLKTQSTCVDNIRYNAGKDPPGKASLRECLRVVLPPPEQHCNTSS